MPIPAPNTPQVSGTKTVKVEGQISMVKRAQYSASLGDEVGSAVVIVSAVIKGGMDLCSIPLM